MICRTDEYELTISYSWEIPQGMSGHLFECIEYFYILKDHFKSCIFIGENIPKDYIETAIRNKYSFTELEVQEILNAIIIKENPAILTGNNLLFTDANFSKMKTRYLVFKTYMGLPCANLDFQNNPNVHIFQDDRIYGQSEANTFHYIKKILLNKYKNVNKSVDNVNLIYDTKNTFNEGEDYYLKMGEQYTGDFLILTNKNKLILPERFAIEKMPVTDLFEKFSTYIYIPVAKKRDCSPRFLVECKHYNKNVIFHNIDYWEEDLGLKYRVYDIENDFKSLYLDENDQIVDLVNQCINK